MRKVLCLIAVLAMASSAFAGNLDVGAAIPWHAPWGDPADVTDLGGGVINLDIGSNNGSAGIFWRLPAFPSEIVSVTGTWEGDCGGSGWAEVMFFTSTEGLDDSVVANRMDVGAGIDIAAKHDSWGLNGGPVFGPEPIEAAPHPSPGGVFELHATCSEVIIGLKVGNTANVTYDLTYIPEPATALLLGLPLLLVRRRR